MADRIELTDRFERIRADFSWYLKLLNSLCGKYEEWTFPKAQRTHECEFGHPIPVGARYLRKPTGPDRSDDAKLCEDCGVKFLFLLFDTGSGSVDLASSILRERYDSVFVAMKKMERQREGSVGQTTPLVPAPTVAHAPERGSAPKWSSVRLAEMRRSHPRAYEKWTAMEDDQLRTMHLSEVAVEQMAQELKRQPSAVRCRLRKLGLAGDPNSPPFARPSA